MIQSYLVLGHVQSLRLHQDFQYHLRLEEIAKLPAKLPAYVPPTMGRHSIVNTHIVLWYCKNFFTILFSIVYCEGKNFTIYFLYFIVAIFSVMVIDYHGNLNTIEKFYNIAGIVKSPSSAGGRDSCDWIRANQRTLPTQLK